MHKLIKLTPQYQQPLAEMLDEWRADLSLTGAKPIPAPIFKNDPADIEKYIAELEYKEPADGMVPDSVLFLLDTDTGRLLGAVHIRHYLNDALRQWSGHIGMGIRPTERRRGRATEMLRLALDECGKLGIERVQITCDKANTGSARAIVKNGGELEREYVNPAGADRQQYGIRL